MRKHLTMGEPSLDPPDDWAPRNELDAESYLLQVLNDENDLIRTIRMHLEEGNSAGLAMIESLAKDLIENDDIIPQWFSSDQLIEQIAEEVSWKED